MTKLLHDNFTALVARMDTVSVPVADWEALSERFQGTIGRTFWYDVSRIVQSEEGDDLMLVTVHAPRSDDDHLHVEVTNGTIEETLSYSEGHTNATRFQTHSVYMTYPDWKTLMCDLMDYAWSEGV